MAAFGADQAAAFLAAFTQAWLDIDADAAVGLVTDDFTYRWHPTEAPIQGRAAWHAYWISEGQMQHDLDIRWRDPIVRANEMAVEIWVTMRYAGGALSSPDSADMAATPDSAQPITAVGSFFGEFTADGLCRAMREYMVQLDGIHSAPPDYRNRAGRE